MKKQLAHWNTYARLWTINREEIFMAGEYILAEHTGARDFLIKKHTLATDAILSCLNPSSIAFLKHLKKRCITFEEFTYWVQHQKTHVTKGEPLTFALQYGNLIKNKLVVDHASNLESVYISLIMKGVPQAKSFFFNPMPVPVPLNALNRHVLITGRSGSGKTEFIKSLFYQVQRHTHNKQQASLILLDPHGDLSEQLFLLRLNSQKSDRLWYIDPTWSQNTIPCLNPFWDPIENPILVDLMAQQWAKAFAELIPETGLTLQMETLLKPCLAVLFEKGGCGLSDLQNFMDDSQNATWVDLGKQSQNPVFKRFFQQAFLHKKYSVTKMAVYTRLQHLLNNYVFYQVMNGKTTVDLRQGMNNGNVILFNLSKGKLGEDTSKALGRFISATLLSIALQRAFESENTRKPCYLFIDEFQNMASSSIEIMFSEARKYHLHLIVGTQSVGQLPPSLKEMVLNNTAVKLVGLNGLPALKSQAGDIGVSYAQLQNLPPFHFYLKYDHHPALKIKSTNALLMNPTKYFISEKSKTPKAM